MRWFTAPAFAVFHTVYELPHCGRTGHFSSLGGVTYGSSVHGSACLPTSFLPVLPPPPTTCYCLYMSIPAAAAVLFYLPAAASFHHLLVSGFLRIYTFRSVLRFYTTTLPGWITTATATPLLDATLPAQFYVLPALLLPPPPPRLFCTVICTLPAVCGYHHRYTAHAGILFSLFLLYNSPPPRIPTSFQDLRLFLPCVLYSF